MKWQTLSEHFEASLNIFYACKICVGCHLFQRGRLVALPAERGAQLPDRAPPVPQDEPLPLPHRRTSRSV